MRFERFILRAAVFMAGAALVPCSARAGTVQDEVSVNTAQATEANPRSGNVADSLSAHFDLSDQWSLSLGGLLTLEGKTPAAQRGQFPTSGALVSTVSLGLDWDPDDHLSFGAAFDFSPSSTQFAGTQLTLNTPNKPTRDASALVQSDTANLDLALDFGYDTAGESDAEWAFNTSAQVTKLDSEQNISSVRFADSSKPEKKDALVTYCASHKCPRSLQAALQDTSITLRSIKLSASGTLTAWVNTDFTLTGDYYGYDQDPTQLGYFSVAYAGRSVSTGGNGIPLAPLRFLLRPEVTHRFGDLSVRLYLQAGEYVPGAGQGTAGVGAKVQYKFTKRFKLWIALAGQADTDDAGNKTNSGTFGLGAGYRF